MRTTGLLCLIGVAFGCGDNIDPRGLTGRAIGGSVWHDENGDNLLDNGETPLEGFTLFLDLNNNELADPGEPKTQSDATGFYAFRDLEPGAYVVRQAMPFGWRSVFEPSGARIIGGAEADPLEYGFMASVGFVFNFGGGDEHFAICGSVLVSDRFVVTAAHCSEGVAPEDASVLLGANDLADPDARLVLVSAIAIHPAYTGDVEEGNDIAVWQLAERLDLAALGLHTVELLGSGTTLENSGVLATTIGWGVSDLGSALLQEVHLPLVSEASCAAAYPQVEITATEICAGVSEGGADTCQGDSGGPLLVRDVARSRWVSAGITSWGEGCALPDFPGVYARTSALKSWAEGVMTESSRAHRVDVINKPVFADFGNQETVRPQLGDIAGRWQATNFGVAESSAGVVEADAPLTFEFGILAERGRGLSFDCEFDPDGPGALAARSVACASGPTSIAFAGYPEGAYQPGLIITADGKTMSRRPILIAGTPATTTTNGALTTGDQVDPDFVDTYYIDHFELVGAIDNVLVVADISSGAFEPYFALYDADQRTAAGGGLLFTGEGRLAFFPEPGRRYLLGVSTFFAAQTGAYAITVISDGALTPVTL